LRAAGLPYLSFGENPIYINYIGWYGQGRVLPQAPPFEQKNKNGHCRAQKADYD
jgi:hypothetical protein